jgi:glycosyltransferase involved in cell wall biosynthesis
MEAGMTSEWPLLVPAGEMLDPPRPVTVGMVITAHNVARFLPAALDSVFAQTRLPDEVVVCDDASEDDVPGAVEPYRDRVRLIRRPVRGGEGAAKNTAVAAMDADLAIILDGDDEMAPQRVEAMTWLAERRADLHLISTAWEDFGPGVRNSEWSVANHFPVVDQRGEILRWNFLPAPAIRRQALLDAGGFDENLRYGPDWECYVRMFLRGATAGLIPLPLYRYRRWGGQQTADAQRVLSGRARVAEMIAANGLLEEHERATAARVLADARFQHWTWRAREGRVTRRETVALARRGHLSARRLALLAVTAGMPPLGRQLLLRHERDGGGG